MEKVKLLVKGTITCFMSNSTRQDKREITVVVVVGPCYPGPEEKGRTKILLVRGEGKHGELKL